MNGAVPGGEDLVHAAVRITGLAVDGGVLALGRVVVVRDHAWVCAALRRKNSVPFRDSCIT